MDLKRLATIARKGRMERLDGRLYGLTQYMAVSFADPGPDVTFSPDQIAAMAKGAAINPEWSGKNGANGQDARRSAVAFAESDKLPGWRHDLAQAVQDVAGASSAESTRYYLNGVHMEAGDQGSIEATDGHRLYRVRTGAREFALPESVILPNEAVKALAKFGPAIVYYRAVPGQSPWLFFEGAEARLAVRCIDGTFPDLDRAIPSQTCDQVALEPVLGPLKAIAKEAKPLGESGIIFVKLEDTEAGIKLTSHRPLGIATPRLVEGVRLGEGREIGFNASYLAEAVAFVGDGAAIRAWDGSRESPILIASGHWRQAVVMSARCAW